MHAHLELPSLRDFLFCDIPEWLNLSHYPVHLSGTEMAPGKLIFGVWCLMAEVCYKVWCRITLRSVVWCVVCDVLYRVM